MEILIIILSISAIVMYGYRLYVTLDLTSRVEKTYGKEYMKFQYVGKPCGSASLNFVCGITISLVLCKEGLMLSPGDVRSSSYLFMDPHPLEIGFLGSKGNCQQLFSPLFLLFPPSKSKRLLTCFLKPFLPKFSEI